VSGWIKLQRDILDHWIAQDAEYLLVWIRMLSEANFEPRTIMFNGQIVTVGRGQLIFGLKTYSDKTKMSEMRLRTLISLLEKHSMINRVKFSKYSLISIVNYDKYQTDNRQEAGSEQADNSQGTGSEQAGNNTIRSKRNKESNNGKNVSEQFDFSSWPEMPSNQLMTDWINIRKSKKAAITQTAINRIGKQLHIAKLSGWSVEESLSVAVSSAWTGFEASWLKRDQQKGIAQLANGYQEFLNE